MCCHRRCSGSHCTYHCTSLSGTHPRCMIDDHMHGTVCHRERTPYRTTRSDACCELYICHRLQLCHANRYTHFARRPVCWMFHRTTPRHVRVGCTGVGRTSRTTCLLTNTRCSTARMRDRYSLGMQRPLSHRHCCTYTRFAGTSSRSVSHCMCPRGARTPRT